jgi:hypothetical protein
MAEPGLRLNAENAKIVIKIGVNSFDSADTLKSASFDPIVVEHGDDFIGSTATDPDQQVRGWTIKMDAFHTNSLLADALDAREARRIARTMDATDEITIIVILFNRTVGVGPDANGYTFQKCELKPIALNLSGATERIMDGIEGRAKFKKVVTF